MTSIGLELKANLVDIIAAEMAGYEQRRDRIRAQRLGHLADYIASRTDDDVGMQEVRAHWCVRDRRAWLAASAPDGGPLWDWITDAPDPREEFRRLRLSWSSCTRTDDLRSAQQH